MARILSRYCPTGDALAHAELLPGNLHHLFAARARGKRGGRPRLLPNAKKIALAKSLYNDRKTPIPEICNMLNISRATLYRYLGKSASK